MVARRHEYIKYTSSVLKVAKYTVGLQESSNVHNESVLEVSENKLFPEPLMLSKIYRYCFFSVYLQNLGFGCLTVIETELFLMFTERMLS